MHEMSAAMAQPDSHLASIIVRDESSGVEIEYCVKSDQCLGYLARHFSQKQRAAVEGICLQRCRDGRTFTELDLDSTFQQLEIGHLDVLVVQFQQDKASSLGPAAAAGPSGLAAQTPAPEGTTAPAQQAAPGDGRPKREEMEQQLLSAKRARWEQQHGDEEEQGKQEEQQVSAECGVKEERGGVAKPAAQQLGQRLSQDAGAADIRIGADRGTCRGATSTGTGGGPGNGGITCMEELAAQHEHLSAERCRLAAELQSLEASRQEAGRRAQAAAAARCDAAEELGRARGELGEQARAAQAAGAALAEQEAALAEQRARVGALQRELGDLEGRLLEGWRGRNREAQARVDALRTDVGAREAQVAGLKGRLQALGQHVAGLCGELEALEAGLPPALSEIGTC